MKKCLSMAMTLMMLLGLFRISAFAATGEAPSASATVYVTVSNAGSLVMTQKAVTVTDIDEDGTLTINDALYCAHESAYKGGAEAGYAAVPSEWGVSLEKLWGVANGGSYGYYVNNGSAMGLTDTVKDGDYLNAFIYSDLSALSDAYCWFDVNTASATEGDAVTLTLSCYTYDADWNQVVTPVEGATVTIDGVETEHKTDAHGKVTVTFEDAGSFVMSATSDTQTLVPPVCIVSVAEAPFHAAPFIMIAVAAVAVVAGVAVFVVIKRKKN